MMLLGSGLWAYIIGCGCTILASLSPASDDHRRTIGMLNHFVKDKAVNDEASTNPNPNLNLPPYPYP